jgi:hypothetical protein
MAPLRRKPTLPVASTPPPRLLQTRFVAGRRKIHGQSFGATTGHGEEEVEELQVDSGAQEAAEAGRRVHLPVRIDLKTGSPRRHAASAR